MPFPIHYLLQFGGDLGTEEIWSCGIRLSDDGGIGPIVTGPEDLVDDLADDITTWMADGTSGWSSRSKLRFVKFNRIGADGRYTDPSNTVARFYDTAPFPAGTSTTGFPNSVACVLSWTTSAARGRASMGRIYMPAPALGMDNTTGRFGTAVPLTGVASAAATFLTNVNNQPGLDSFGYRASVVSRLGAGLRRDITGVRVGNVPDTMRSRRNAMDELYVSAAVS